jgi:hypothetical protein
VANVAEVEFQTDQEQQEDEPDLAEHREDPADHLLGEVGRQGVDLGTKQSTEHVGRQPAQQGRPKHQAGDDFSHHRRLPQAAEQRREQPCRQQDDDQLDEDRQEDVLDRGPPQRLHQIDVCSNRQGMTLTRHDSSPGKATRLTGSPRQRARGFGAVAGLGMHRARTEP